MFQSKVIENVNVCKCLLSYIEPYLYNHILVCRTTQQNAQWKLI